MNKIPLPHLNSNKIRMIKGYEDGSDTSLYLDVNSAYLLWIEHYDSYLKRLYSIFQTECYNNSIPKYSNIDFQKFCKFIWNNSSKYLSPWL